MKFKITLFLIGTLLLQTKNAKTQNTFPASGNVGIGTIAPASLLDVRGKILVDGMTIGMGGIDTMSTRLGRNALMNQQATSIWGDGFFENVAIGYRSMFANTQGIYNTAVGSYSLNSNITGRKNTALGELTLYSNTTGIFNTAVGQGSMFANTSGISNTAVGLGSLAANTTGADNTAVGVSSLAQNVLGSQNTALGALALTSNTASFNTALGHSSLMLNSTGTNNTASGYLALDSNTTGSNNSADGYFSMGSNKTGNNNVGYGSTALSKNTTGSYNTAVGYGAGILNVSGNNNVAVGYFASPNTGAITNSVAIGNLASTTASNQVRIGNNSITSIGGIVGWTNLSDARVKKNIKENVPGLQFINLLKPVTYNLDIKTAERLTGTDRSNMGGIAVLDKEEEKAAAKMIHSGFLAQDVEKAANSIQYQFSGVDAPKNNKDLYGLRYGEFVVPLVKAVQELSKMNDEKDDKISKLQNELAELKQLVYEKLGKQHNNSIVLSSALLEQNTPNPFSGTTGIGYTLPDSYTNAKIVITDARGATVKEINISGSGKGRISLNTGLINSGNYQYALYVNNVLVATKQMIQVK